jgi:ribosomal protein S18 acetylase RimI-like enzyme
MDANTISYKVNTASEKEIHSHLSESNSSFIPPLSERVNILDYSKKLFERSVTFEAWADNKLIGLIAAYFDKETNNSFITNVSVAKAYGNLGIAGNLLNMCIDHLTENKGNEIQLEVHKENLPAISFYTKFNFFKAGTKEDMLILKLVI